MGIVHASGGGSACFVQEGSRILVIKTSKEAHDNLEHRSAKAYFVACFATEDAKALRLSGHCFVMLALLLLKFLLPVAILPMVPLRVPVSRRSLSW
jgi:hypothetical protein